MEIMTLAPGEKISREGLYDIPLDVYHSDICEGHSTSKTPMMEMIQRTPFHYHRNSYLNPNRPGKETKAKTLGQIAHAKLFGDKHFERLFEIAPFENWNTNEGLWTVTKKKAWKAEVLFAGKQIVMTRDLETVREMEAVLLDTPEIQGGLFRGEVELSMIWKDPETGIWIKSRPDVLPADDWFADYKTQSDLDWHALQRDIAGWGYRNQAALAAEGMLHLTGRMLTDFVLVFQEPKFPYAVRIEHLAEDQIERGAQENRAALRKIANCLERNEWPSYTVSPYGIGLMKWEKEEGEKLTGLDEDLPEPPEWVERLKQESAAKRAADDEASQRGVA